MKIITRNLNDTWKFFILENKNGMKVKIFNYGAVITEIMVPDKKGNFENVVLGFQDYKEYQNNFMYLGAVIGPVAGRIKGSSFDLDGEIYELETNDGTNHLHGGAIGFHHVVWDAVPFETVDEIGVKLSYHSAAGEYGYPGNVIVHVTYSLNNENQLTVDYHATTDQTTPITLTNHTYFNLTGDLKDTVLNHQVEMNSDQYLELDQELIPTGNVRDVKDTTFDFTKGRTLKDGVVSIDKQNSVVGNGYDHYFLFDSKELGKVKVQDPLSGRVLTITTDQPGMVMYTGNNLEEGVKLNGGISKKYLGVCFETQGTPASLHQHALPSILLNKGEAYQKRTIFSFGVQ